MQFNINNTYLTAVTYIVTLAGSLIGNVYSLYSLAKTRKELQTMKAKAREEASPIHKPTTEEVERYGHYARGAVKRPETAGREGSESGDEDSCPVSSDDTVILFLPTARYSRSRSPFYFTLIHSATFASV